MRFACSYRKIRKCIIRFVFNPVKSRVELSECGMPVCSRMTESKNEDSVFKRLNKCLYGLGSIFKHETMKQTPAI